jgi:hypothetical protein
MVHGLLQSSGTFCVNDEDSLAFFLCKSGYDVWLGNNRGYFSPEHISLKPSSHRFWAWNLLQMGTSDLPAMISYIKSQTNREKVLACQFIKLDCPRRSFSRGGNESFDSFQRSTTSPWNLTFLSCCVDAGRLRWNSPPVVPFCICEDNDGYDLSHLFWISFVYTPYDVDESIYAS